METAEVVNEIRNLSKEGQRFQQLPGLIHDYEVWRFKLKTLWNQASFRKVEVFDAEPVNAPVILKILDYVEETLAEEDPKSSEEPTVYREGERELVQ